MWLLYILFGVLLHKMKLFYILFCCSLAQNVVVVYIVLLFSCTGCGCGIHCFAIFLSRMWLLYTLFCCSVAQDVVVAYTLFCCSHVQGIRLG